MNPPPYELNITILTQGVLALLGFFGLIATATRPHYIVAALIVTAVPAIMAIGFLGFSALVGWTNGVHTFVDSWGPLSHSFAYTAPFFIPTLVAGALLIIRKRPAWVKLLVVVLAIGVLYALCVYRWLFS
ncbi:hypothetical protein [Microbacterium sp. NPDC058345]|uniref:hypothetical protein n=1 Tax=Microbacterium sp. NPDC058345 TaxID=3346455 RepID=UPI00364B93BC